MNCFKKRFFLLKEDIWSMSSICDKWLLFEWDSILEVLIIINYLGKYGWDDSNSKWEFAKEIPQKYYFLRVYELN